MNKKLRVLGVVFVVLGVMWFTTRGRALFHTEMQDALLICARPDCMNEFTARIPIPFDHWPAACPKCGNKSAYPSLSCPECEQNYPFIPKQPLKKCPRCDAELPL